MTSFSFLLSCLCFSCCCSFHILFSFFSHVLLFLCSTFLFSTSFFFYNISSCCFIDRGIATASSKSSLEKELLIQASCCSCTGPFLYHLGRGIFSFTYIGTSLIGLKGWGLLNRNQPWQDIGKRGKEADHNFKLFTRLPAYAICYFSSVFIGTAVSQAML